MLWSDEKKIYGDPKKLSSFKKTGKPASIQPNIKAATSLFRKQVLKTKVVVQPLKFRIIVILYKSAVKSGRREQSKLKIGNFLL